MAFPKDGLVFNPGDEGEAWEDPFHSGASSDDDEKVMALEPDDWEAKFKLLDERGEVYGRWSEVANMKPACNVSTLKRRYKTRSKNPIPLGAQPVLPPAVETLLVEWLTWHHVRNFPRPIEEVKKKAKELAVELGGENAAALVGGDRWFKLFMGRHPEVKVMTASNMEEERVHAFSRESIERYQDIVEVTTEGVKRENIYFTDEACLEGNPTKGYKVSRLFDAVVPNSFLNEPPPLPTGCRPSWCHQS